MMTPEQVKVRTFGFYHLVNELFLNLGLIAIKVIFLKKI